MRSDLTNEEREIYRKGEEYQGWANHATWAINLSLTNDEGSAGLLRDIIANSLGDDHAAAEGIKRYIEEEMPDLGNTFWADLLNAALGDVNWLEIIENNKEG